MDDNLKNHIAKDRRDFGSKGFSIESLSKEPLEQFEEWLGQAIQDSLQEPYAMCLSTLGDNGYPSSRIVFLRDIRNGGLIFYTNYGSAKSKEVAAHPKVALNFHWEAHDRQVHVKGTVQKVDSSISDSYFSSRPRSSQIGAWASSQSEPLQSREELEARITSLEERFEDREVLRPEFWGGYVVSPVEWQFWQGRTSRLHDRVRYTQDGNTWTKTRLNP